MTKVESATAEDIRLWRLQASTNREPKIWAGDALVLSLIATIDSLTERAEKAETLVYSPGAWRCAKCNFRLIQANLNAADGTVTARDQPGDKCPNCSSPLWRVTWKDEAMENLTLGEQQVARAAAAEAERDALRAEVGRLRGDLEGARTEADDYNKDLAEARGPNEWGLCEGCPPDDYPTNATRCYECPRYNRDLLTQEPPR